MPHQSATALTSAEQPHNKTARRHHKRPQFSNHNFKHLKTERKHRKTPTAKAIQSITIQSSTTHHQTAPCNNVSTTPNTNSILQYQTHRHVRRHWVMQGNLHWSRNYLLSQNVRCHNTVTFLIFSHFEISI